MHPKRRGSREPPGAPPAYGPAVSTTVFQGSASDLIGAIAGGIVVVVVVVAAAIATTILVVVIWFKK